MSAPEPRPPFLLGTRAPLPPMCASCADCPVCSLLVASGGCPCTVQTGVRVGNVLETTDGAAVVIAAFAMCKDCPMPAACRSAGGCVMDARRRSAEVLARDDADTWPESLTDGAL